MNEYFKFFALTVIALIFIIFEKIIKLEKGQMSFLSLLTLVFITLKLTDFIHWSWIWVLAPIWMPFALIALTLLMWLVGYMCVKIYQLSIREHQ